MFEEDYATMRARSLASGYGSGLSSHGLMPPAPQAFPFAGFPVHPAHDPMGFAGEFGFFHAIFQ